MENGRCRMHGGKSTGAPEGNTNAVSHGIYSTALDDEEKAAWERVEVDSLDEEIKLVKVKIARVERAIARLESGDESDFYLFERRNEVRQESGKTSRQATETRKRPDWYSQRLGLLRTLARLESTKVSMVQAGIVSAGSPEEKAQSVRDYLRALNESTLTPPDEPTYDDPEAVVGEPRG